MSPIMTTMLLAAIGCLLLKSYGHADVMDLHRPAFASDRSGLDSLQALLSGEGETKILSGPASAVKPSSSFEEVQHDMPIFHEPHHDCHIEVQVTERVRGYCSELNVMGKSFPVCKNGERVSINHHECAFAV
ncbi:uncharacterized protein LOC135366256 [Ornithodoros turicata]|uniref:uncharacterized protein LOC135366256 n=1 Tax=Ornithodoros turicata TaxID=34597 RepID=UPI0031386A04